MQAPTDEKAEAQELSLQEGRVLLDKQARRYLGRSGDEFIEAWQSGQFKGRDSPEVMRVAMLPPFAMDGRENAA